MADPLALATELVQQAPALSATTVAELRAALAADSSPLALAIARVVELVHAGSIDAAISLPALAEATATLMASRDPNVLAAAHYQIDTLLPVPARPHISAPDVPLAAVKRR